MYSYADLLRIREWVTTVEGRLVKMKIGGVTKGIEINIIELIYKSCGRFQPIEMLAET